MGVTDNKVCSRRNPKAVLPARHQNTPLLTLCEGNTPVTDGFPSQRASNGEFCCPVGGLPSQRTSIAKTRMRSMMPLVSLANIVDTEYRQVSNIRRTKSQHLRYSRTALRLSLPNPLKPDVKARIKM